MRSLAPLLLLGVALATLGCEDPEPAEATPTGSLPRGELPLDALSRRHARLRERMVSRGYEERPPAARVFVVEDRGVVLPLDVATGVCTTYVAIASGALRDLRLSLYDGEGAEAARDDVPGEGGLVHVCPQAAPGVARAPYYLTVEARDGTGSVAIAEFRSAPGEGDGFEGLFDEVLAPRVPFPQVEARLAEMRTALRSRGLSATDAPRVQWVGEGGALRMPVRFETGHCYVAAASGGPGTRDVDLFLFDPGGVEVGRDLGTDAEPTVEHCPETSGLFIVEARAFEGEGAIGVMVLAAPSPALSREEAGDLGALDAERPRSEGNAPEVALGVLAAELARRGFEAPIFASRDASIAPGETRTHEVVAGPGCALIVASASHAGMDVDLYLADAAGRAIDADTAVHATARVRACRREATVLRVAVKAYGRDGRYALAVIRAPAGITGVQDLRLEEAIAGPRARGSEVTERFAVTLGAGVPFTRDVRIPAGRCIAVAAAGAESVSDVDLFLRDPSGTLVVSDAGPSALATISRCAEDADTPLRLEVFAEGGGEVQLAILEGSAP